ncbi:hypothetical protein BDM02DRAFT_3187837 [Thelephora ganbajun]|uniref:Uncharacterized protein n=1 Tax=Thelephora ganbajun TaxID=370292 RepID=A0ACB6ZDC1_THEGA|nr:hypothetical protein BDM02DRAFT_3187837 [Thelephora ganbajun]
MLTYGEVISHEPSPAGRSTAVLHAKSPTWKDIDLVVKISWTGSDRKVVSLLDNAEFVNGEYKYERRTLRIIVQERLYLLKTLTNAKDIAQVLLDVACIHRWLWEKAEILHRDLSLNNTTYRIIKGKVYGVLTDFDLASRTAPLMPGYTKTSEQRIGTPYTAHGLLDGIDALHIYRHDVESLFYVMLILATHHEIETPGKEGSGGVRTRRGLEELPYQEWFDQSSYKALASFKQTSFSRLGELNLF